MKPSSACPGIEYGNARSGQSPSRADADEVDAPHVLQEEDKRSTGSTRKRNWTLLHVKKKDLPLASCGADHSLVEPHQSVMRATPALLFLHRLRRVDGA